MRSFNDIEDELRRKLDYCPDTGELVWRENSNTHKRGDIAGSIVYSGKSRDRYISINTCGRKIKAHRLAWLLHYGSEPESIIDHINGDGTDNKISNLRLSSASENAKNMKLFKSNSSQICGVHWVPKISKWRAEIRSSGKRMVMGHFASLFDAACVRRSAENRLGFTARHGM